MRPIRLPTWHRKGAAGFTLVELLIVVAIIAVVASMALPAMRKFVMRARRVEAYLGLSGIHTAQTAHYAAFNRYAESFDELGFELEGGVRVDPSTIDAGKYRFEMGVYDYQGAPAGNFWATATADLNPGDGVLDVLLVENHAIVKE